LNHVFETKGGRGGGIEGDFHHVSEKRHTSGPVGWKRAKRNTPWWSEQDTMMQRLRFNPPCKEMWGDRRALGEKKKAVSVKRGKALTGLGEK